MIHPRFLPNIFTYFYYKEKTISVPKLTLWYTCLLYAFIMINVNLELLLLAFYLFTFMLYPADYKYLDGFEFDSQLREFILFLPVWCYIVLALKVNWVSWHYVSFDNRSIYIGIRTEDIKKVPKISIIILIYIREKREKYKRYKRFWHKGTWLHIESRNSTPRYILL